MRQLQIARENPLWQSKIFLDKWEKSKEFMLTNDEETTLLTDLGSDDDDLKQLASGMLLSSSLHLILRTIPQYTADENLVEPLEQAASAQVTILIDRIMQSSYAIKNLYQRFVAWWIRQAILKYLEDNEINPHA